MTYIKTSFLQTFFFILVLLTFGSSCNVENLNKSTAEMLEGKWEMTSWLDDGTERIGVTLNSSTLEFDSSNDTGGSSEWILNDALGGTNTFNIIYSVINGGSEISFSGDIFTIEFVGSNIKIEGATDSSTWEIEAKKQ